MLEVRAGTLSDELRDALGPELIEFYDVGALLAGDIEGTWWWLIEQSGSALYGPAVGPQFVDVVRAAWSPISPTWSTPQA